MTRSFRWSAVVTVALSWLALAAPMAPAQVKAKKVATVEGITEYHLPNGARFLLFPDKSASTVTVNMTVLVGSRHEGYGESGMAHLLEHMCFKGTPTHPNIDKALQEHGGSDSANGTTWLDRTNYYETMPGTDKNLEFGIKLAADILVNSHVKKEDLVKEMTVVRNEFERGENTPEYILSQRMVAVAFEWHNYGKTTIGNRADIERVPIENLQAFYKKYYQPDNIVLVIAGKFDQAKAVAFAEKYFGALKKPDRVLPKTYTEEPAQDGERVVVLNRVGKVPVVGTMYHIPGVAHEDFAALDVLSTMLVQEPSGKLYKALVKTKKATYVDSFTLATHDPFVMEFTASVAGKTPPTEVRDILIDVVEKLGDGNVTEAEVARAKSKMATDFERLLTKTDKVATQLSEWIGAGDWRLMFIHRDRVANVTVKDVVAVAKKYLKKSNRTVGMFVPTDKPDRTPVPEIKDIAALVGMYKGAPELAPGENFDPSPETLEKRTKRFTLPNGLKVAFLSKKTRGETVRGSITLRFGNEKSLVGKTTAASFMGSLMMRGTTKMSYEDIEDALIVAQSKLSVSSGAGSLSFSLSSKRGKLADVLKVLHEVARNPVFPEDELLLLKAETKQSLEQGMTDPQTLASNALRRKLNPHPKDSIHYVPTIQESLDRVEKVTRDEVVKIYNDQIGATVGEIVFVGDFDEDATKKALEATFGGWKAKTPYQRIASKPSLDVKGGKEMIETPDKESANYIAGYQFAMDDNDPDYVPLLLGNYILGQAGFNSRIMERLRQKEGLSYGAGSSFSAGSIDKFGSFSLFATCNPENMAKLEKAMKEEIDAFAKKGITKEELDEAVKGWLQERKVDRASDSVVLGQLSNQLYLGRDYNRTIAHEAKIAALTVDQVNAAIAKHFTPDRFYIVEAGDFAKAKKK